MQEVLLLYQALQIHFIKANQAKLKCLAQAVLAILAVKNCSLAQIATGFKGKTKTNSHFRRLQRWVAAPLIPLDVLAKWLVSLFDFPEQMTLALDRTNWKFGKININVFMLTGCYKRLALPLFWMLLSKRGNSSDKEKQSLLQKFVDVFGVGRIKYLLGDREFAGVAWFNYLCEVNLPFVFRIKGKYTIFIPAIIFHQHWNVFIGRFEKITNSIQFFFGFMYQVFIVNKQLIFFW